MKADKIQFVAYPRSPYLSLDLGVLMFRRWWNPLITISFLLFLPAFLPLLWLTYTFESWWPLLILWWLKPLFERALLHYYSHAVFADFLTIRQTLGAWLRLLKPQLLQTLTYRRLSPSRSMSLPVIQLEGLSGKARSKRLHLLRAQNFGSAAGWLTIFGAHIEFFIQTGLLVLVGFFIPEGIYFELTLFESPTFGISCLFISSVLIAPLYVGCGFALYLNRRTALEGWDIELTFRQLQKRLSQQQKSPHSASGSKLSTIAIGLSLLLTLGLFQPHYVNAEPQQEASYIETPEQAKKRIETVLKGERFHQQKTQLSPKWPFESEEEEEDEPFSFDFPDWLAHLPFVLEILLWISIASVILLLIFKYRDSLLELGLGRKTPPSSPLPEQLFSLDVRKESLPEDVPAEATLLWQQDNFRAAIALLYRASLAHLLHQHKLPLRAGHTESECVQLAKSHIAQEPSDYFARLTQAWLMIAYGHRPPSEPLFEQLCQLWSSQFKEQLTGAENE